MFDLFCYNYITKKGEVNLNAETINQAYLFLIFILNGVLIGIIFDIFRILRKSFKTPNFITYIEDILFWIISAIIILYSLFIFNNGQFRGYIFIGIFFGIAIYMLFFSKFIINFSVKIISFVKKTISFIFKIISFPIKIIFNIIKRIVFKPFIQISTKIFNYSKKILKNTNKHDKIIQNKEGI